MKKSIEFEFSKHKIDNLFDIDKRSSKKIFASNTESFAPNRTRNHFCINCIIGTRNHLHQIHGNEAHLEH